MFVLSYGVGLVGHEVCLFVLCVLSSVISKPLIFTLMCYEFPF